MRRPDLRRIPCESRDFIELRAKLFIYTMYNKLKG